MSTMTQQDVQVGCLAPDFTLASTSGKPFTLSAQRGEKNVLLAFFPMAFTSVCQSELCDFWSEMEEFERTGTRVVGISVDAIPSLKAFQQSANMKTELLSDFKREVSRLYGPLTSNSLYSSMNLGGEVLPIKMSPPLTTASCIMAPSCSSRR